MKSYRLNRLFNPESGYILGLLSGCGAETRLQTACAVSGFFVRNGHSPSRAELKNFPRKPPSDS
jgi:hypothetical protein